MTDTCLTNVLRSDRVYLCPKADGHIYIGATEEELGGSVFSSGLDSLWADAVELCPLLAEGEVVGRYDGLRPVAEGGVPYVGAVEGWERLYAACGHDRNGVLLAPWTAQRVVADLGF